MKEDFFKLMNNSVFGKKMENTMTRVDIRLVSERRKVIRLASKVSYKDSTIFDKNLIAIHIQPSRLMSSIVVEDGSTVFQNLFEKFSKKFIKKAKYV